MNVEIHNCDAEWLLINKTCDVIITDTPFGYTNAGRGFKREGTTDLLYNSFSDEWDTIDYVELHNHYMPLMFNCAKKAVYVYCPVERLGYFHTTFPNEYRGHIIQCITNPVPSFLKSTYRTATVALAYFHLSGKINWLGHKEMYSWQSATVCGPGKKVYWHNYDGILTICAGRKCTLCGVGCEKHSHPTQKTRGQITTPILASSVEGDTILDPFAGVGTTMMEAESLLRNVIIGDRNSTYCTVAALWRNHERQ